MALADQPVQVGHALLGGGQQDNVVALLAGVGGKAGVQLIERGDALLLPDLVQHLDEQ